MLGPFDFSTDVVSAYNALKALFGILHGGLAIQTNKWWFSEFETNLFIVKGRDKYYLIC